MFGKNKKYPYSRSSSHRATSHRRTSGVGSSRRRQNWSSSVVGSHAQGAAPSHRASSARSSSRTTRRNMNARGSELHQMTIDRSVDKRTARHQVGKSRTEGFMRRQNTTNRIFVVVAIVLIIAIAFGAGSCVYRSTLTSSMALNDDSVTEQLVAPKSNDDPCNILIAGITGDGTASEAASYLAVMRVDPGKKVVSLINIPSNIATSYGSDADGDMLRDAPHAKDEGELVSQVSSLIEGDINHYVRLTDEGFISLVDSLGGLNITVDQVVDDPTVGHIVLDPGEQTLSGEQALTYVSAKNYTNGYTTRADIQSKVFAALVSAVQEKGGLAAAFDADKLASCISTDMDYDTLTSLASVYAESTLYSATMPGSQYVSDKSTYWSTGSSAWETMLKQYAAGESLDVSVDTSGVDKGGLSIIVLNGSGNTGYGAKMADQLTAAGYAIQETGNADAYVYDETLVIYREESGKQAAEAIVQDLGCGRAVYASVYYSLTTDIQVVVGKDWNPS